MLGEPTVGLHVADVEKLIHVLHRLVNGGGQFIHKASGRHPLPQWGGYLFNGVGATASTNCTYSWALDLGVSIMGR